MSTTAAMLAEVLVAIGRISERIDSIERTIVAERNRVETIVRVGIDAYENGKDEKARAAAHEAPGVRSLERKRAQRPRSKP